MKPKRKIIAILALIAIVGLVSSAFAVTYMTITQTYHASIGTVGAIQLDVLHTLTVAPTNLNFDQFNTTQQPQTFNYTLRNVGNQNLNVTWSQTSDATLNSFSQGYNKYISGVETWRFEVINLNTTNPIVPNGQSPLSMGVLLNKGDNIDIQVILNCYSTLTSDTINPNINLIALSAS